MICIRYTVHVISYTVGNTYTMHMIQAMPICIYMECRCEKTVKTKLNSIAEVDGEQIRWLRYSMGQHLYAKKCLGALCKRDMEDAIRMFDICAYDEATSAKIRLPPMEPEPRDWHPQAFHTKTFMHARILVPRGLSRICVRSDPIAICSVPRCYSGARPAARVRVLRVRLL